MPQETSPKCRIRSRSDGAIDGADLALWQQNYDPIGPGGTEGAEQLAIMGDEDFALAGVPLQDEELTEHFADAMLPASDGDLFASGVRARASELTRPLSSMVGVRVRNVGSSADADITWVRHSRMGRLLMREDADLVDILQLSALGTELHI